MPEVSDASPLPGADQLSGAPAPVFRMQFRLRSLFVVTLLLCLVAGWFADHRHLQNRLNADAAVFEQCKWALWRRLRAGGTGKPVAEYPEVGLFACSVSVTEEDYADYLRLKLDPPGKVCNKYYIDLTTDASKVPQEGVVEGFVVYTVDDVIVSLDTISPEW